MKLKVEKSENYKWAIVVDETDLRRLVETIKLSFCSENKDPILKYKIKCYDDSTIETNDINEVLSEENSKERRIENIVITANNHSSTQNIEISLGDRWKLNNKTISYSVTGDTRDWVYLTASKIEDRIKNYKQWYSIFLKHDFIFYMWLIFIVYILSYPKKDSSDIFSTPYYKIFLIVFIIIIVLYLFYELIRISYNYLFPICIFKIGDGIKHYNNIIYLRSNIFWGVFITLFVSLIAGFFLYIIL